MSLDILVNGVSRKWDTDAPITWEDQVDGEGQLTIGFTVRVSPVAWKPEDGQEVLIVRDEPEALSTADGDALLTADGEAILTGPERLFGGTLQEPEETATPGRDYLHYACTAVEFSAIAGRRLVAAVYEQTQLDAIVLDIVARFLTGEGISTDGVQPGGPIIEKAIFNYVTAKEAFNQLSELSGRAWWVDPYRVLHFRARDTILAPVALDNVTLENGTVAVRPDRSKYRNRQLLRAGTDLTDPRAEVLVGDGARRVFGTAFPLGAVPTVEESRAGGPWVPRSIGILGVETGKDWYWNVGQAQVSQDDAGVVLAAPTAAADPTTGDRIRVTYRGTFPVLVRYEDPLEIAARAAVEGGSGIYETVESRPSIDSAQMAIDTARALVDRYGRIGSVLTGRTDRPGFAPGQLATVTLPQHGLAAVQMLIESISAEIPGGLDEVWYTVTAISGDPYGGWQEYFRKLQRAGQPYIIAREGEILVLVRVVAANAGCGAAVAVSFAVPSSVIGVMAVGDGEIGAAA
jgi:hypothetical protein